MRHQALTERDGDLLDRIATFRLTARAVETLRRRVEILEAELGLNRGHVRDRIDLAFDVRDVVVDEAADDVCDRVHLANVGEELVTEALPLRRPSDEPGDVHEANDGGYFALRLEQRRERLEPRVGHRDDADVRLDGTERKIRRLGLGRGQRVEERAFPDVREPNDAARKSHGASRRTAPLYPGRGRPSRDVEWR